MGTYNFTFKVKNEFPAGKEILHKRIIFDKMQLLNKKLGCEPNIQNAGC